MLQVVDGGRPLLGKDTWQERVPEILFDIIIITIANA